MDFLKIYFKPLRCNYLLRGKGNGEGNHKFVAEKYNLLIAQAMESCNLIIN